jgi:hypothetical protein
VRRVIPRLITYDEAVAAGLLEDDAVVAMPPAGRRTNHDLAAESTATTLATTSTGRAGRPSQADQLVELIDELYELVRSADGDGYAVPRSGPRIAVAVRGGRPSLRAAVAAEYSRRHGRTPSSSALTDALAVAEGRAATADHVPIHLRVGATGDAVYLDLGTPSGEVVEIADGAWHVTDTPPVLYRRTQLTSPLPVPVRGGDLDELRDLLNVSEESWPLLVGVLVSWLVPGIPHPLLYLRGEQGTGKTTAAAMLSRVVDPSPAPVRCPPRNVEDWAVAASSSYVVALDNLSTIPPWLSDALCRAATGEGVLRRALYTDAGVSVLRFRRCVVLTAIDAGALAGDLADRLVAIELDRIDPARRRTDHDLAAAYDRCHARILGALLDLAAAILEAIDVVRVPDPPRMADFARVLAAVDEVTGWRSLGTYRAVAADLDRDVVDSDPVADAIRRLVEGDGRWTGTASELLAAITPDSPPRRWPSAPHVLSGQLRRLAPALRRTGIDVEFAHGGRRRLIYLRGEVTPDGDAR